MTDQLRSIERDAAVLVCGLGRIGRQCIEALRGYDVPVRAIDMRPANEIEPELDRDAFTQGDFRDLRTLRRAGVEKCRSIVLVTSDGSANLEGAFAARRANPSIRLVVRAHERAWHQLLAKELGNLVIYEPNRLAAPTFAFAALESDVRAHFDLDAHRFEVIERQVAERDPWVGRRIDEMLPAGRHVVTHVRAGASSEPGAALFGWDPEEKLAVGDRLLLLETAPTRFSLRSPVDESGWQRFLRFVTSVRQYRVQRAGALALVGLAILAGLIMLTTGVLSIGSLRLRPLEALRVASSLLFGAHLSDSFESYEELPEAVHWLELALVTAGTVLTAVLYAVLTDLLLRARFDLRTRRPQVPIDRHVVIAGLGETGRRIAANLLQLEAAVVGVEHEAIEPHVLPSVAIVHGDPTLPSCLLEAQLKTARGIIVATEDDQTNVEIALLARTINPRCRLAVHTFDPRFRENVSFLLPGANVLCASTLAATVYAAAALGEHVLHLFQTPQAPALVVEYMIAQGDSLENKALGEVAEGYRVFPVMHASAGHALSVPGRDHARSTLRAGDYLVVIATATSLEMIERGDMLPAPFQLRLERLRAYADPIEIVGVLSHWLGYTLRQGHEALADLPHVVPLQLYPHHVWELVRLLDKRGLQTSVIKFRAADLTT